MLQRPLPVAAKMLRRELVDLQPNPSKHGVAESLSGTRPLAREVGDVLLLDDEGVISR